ncbi:MAG TPA: hypothetical protein VL728_01815 [Cyclobacteriaceae bacterium]|jgi:hypothetical protein|nr:hypothetical protein [Cyclobacteriaceae bacterium]
MKDFMVIFREPDGRMDVHSAEDNVQHQSKVKSWMESIAKTGNLSGGRALTLKGNVIDTNGKVREDIYKVGKEIVGGYLLLKSNDLRQATEMIKTCPILERGGFAEVREVI